MTLDISRMKVDLLTQEITVDEFTRCRHLIWEQATFIQLWNFGYDTSGAPIYYLIFARKRLIPAPDGYEAYNGGNTGMMWGFEAVGYRANENGEVVSWNHRYEAEAPHFETAVNKIRYQRANGLDIVHNFDDIC